MAFDEEISRKVAKEQRKDNLLIRHRDATRFCFLKLFYYALRNTDFPGSSASFR
jgi:hypothetical protein